MTTCNHRKIYSGTYHMDPPERFRWICEHCGETGCSDGFKKYDYFIDTMEFIRLHKQFQSEA